VNYFSRRNWRTKQKNLKTKSSFLKIRKIKQAVRELKLAKKRKGVGALECWNVSLKFNSTYLLFFSPFSCSSVNISKGTETQITKNTDLAYFFLSKDASSPSKQSLLPNNWLTNSASTIFVF
jgi:hypothetical protein